MMPRPSRHRLKVEEVGDVTIVNFVDRKILDEQNIQVIGEQLNSLVEESERRKLLLNFENVEFLSSATLGKLISLNNKIAKAGGKLVLCNINENIYEVFRITKLNERFNIRKEVHEALQSF